MTGVGAPVVDGVVSGGQIGRAVLIEDDSALAFSMTRGSITDFQRNGLVANNAILAVTGVTITGSGEQGIAQNGIVAFDLSGMISGNAITNLGQVGDTVSIATSVLLYTGNHDLAVTGNTIAGVSAVGRFAGIDVAFDVSGGSITGNTISNADTGVVVEGTVQPQTIAVGGNAVSASDEGVSFSPTNLEAVVAHNVSGSALTDFLMGAAGGDLLTGLAGDDTLFGNGGNDMIWGNQGNDLMSGGDGTDTLFGGQGNDLLYGDAGNDYLEGGVGDDKLRGGDGVDTVGNINSGAGVTVSLLLQGTDEAVPAALISAVAPVQNTGEAGLDSLYGFENLTGSAFADNLTADNAANVIIGGAGNDTVMAVVGDETLFGDAGDDALYGNQDNDVIHGGSGNDTLYGGGRATTRCSATTGTMFWSAVSAPTSSLAVPAPTGSC